jgi:hypothetical protein
MKQKLTSSEDYEQYNWPVAQVTNDKILRDRCTTAELKLDKLKKEFDENTFDKKSTYCNAIVFALCIAAGYCFSKAYQTAGWEDYYLAGYLTIGIVAPICILAAVWLTKRAERVR